MAYRPTRDINDYLDDFESASRDYAEMGPLWAELIFPDDFEAMKAVFGGSKRATYPQTSKVAPQLQATSSAL